MSLAQYLLDIIFPPACLACKSFLKNGGEKSEHLCATCREKLEFLSGFLCPICLRRLPEGERVCHKESRFILAAPLSYSNPVVRELIHTLKYNGLRTAAEPLASVLAAYLSASFENYKLRIENFILVPIPLHPNRERERGYNQAFVIAQDLRDKLKTDIPIFTDVLTKVIPTPSQTEKKDYKEREENIRGSFKILKPELVAGKNILLTDDVFTSGATMREAARVLKSAGANKIIATVIARA